MAGRFVRASKYRHVYGQTGKRELCYDNLRLTKNAWDSNLIKVNPKYASINWEVSGGGAFAVVPLNETGKLPDQVPLFRGHTAAVLDTDWNPFDDHIVVSGSDDAKIGIYRVPDDFTMHQEEVKDIMPVEKLSGHTRKVGHVAFSPAADNVLASSSGDYTIRIWDLAAKSTKLTLKHNDIVTSLSWSADGAMMATTSRDRKLRYWDVRQEKPVTEVPGHAGAKNSRCVWMGEHDRIATTGFSRMSDRQLALWDLRNSSEPVGGFTFLDSVGSISMPFWDDGTQMLYLAGKGDGNIRMYEYEKDTFVELSEFRSNEPQRGLAFMPKRGINTHENEIMRAFKTTNQGYVEPISFIVPRRAEVFQTDIYPPAVGTKPAMDSVDFFSGKPAAVPAKISLESIYDGGEPREVAGPPASATTSIETKTSPASSVTPTLSSAIQPSPSVASSPSKPAASGSLTDSKTSMANMAAKFADKDGDDSDDTSSFEEISRDAITSRKEEKVGVKTPTQTHSAQQVSPTMTSSAPAPAPVPVSPPATGPDDNLPSPSKRNESSAATPTAGPDTDGPDSGAQRSVSAAKGAAQGIKDVLQEMKATIAQQGKQLETQAEQIATLIKQVEALKGDQ